MHTNTHSVRRSGAVKVVSGRFSPISTHKEVAGCNTVVLPLVEELSIAALECWSVRGDLHFARSQFMRYSYLKLMQSNTTATVLHEGYNIIIILSLYYSFCLDLF